MHICKIGKCQLGFSLFLFFFSLVFFARPTIAVDATDTQSARVLASSAYFQIDANRFDQAQLTEALVKLDQAAKLNPDEPFVYLAASLANLVSGYRIGDWYELNSFDAGTLEKSLPLAEKGVKLGPTVSQGYAQLARLHILRKDFANAERNISKAKELDPSNFYPWYFEGIYYEKLRDIASANKAFNEAEVRATRSDQRTNVNRHRSRVASIAHDPVQQEQLLLKNISLSPKDGRFYSEYARFLMCKGRYEESIVQWEKTLTLMPTWSYAQTNLTSARRLAAIEREKRTSC